MSREVNAVVRAWTDSGTHPAYHREAQRTLIRDWPVLASAIEALVETVKMDGRLPRVKESGDHNWEPWSTATLGRGRLCLDCGWRDDGYQHPCVPKDEKQ